MRKVRVKDREFQLSIKASEIQSVVLQIARRIGEDYAGKTPLFLVVLNGAFVFASDLFRHTSLPCEISFIKYRSYSGTSSTNQVEELIGLKEDLHGRDVIIVEDIVDTGITMKHILEKLKDSGASSIKLASLFFKPEAFKSDFKIDYLGMEIPNDFVVGYGLDYDGYGRNYPDLYKEVGKRTSNQ